jgi:hypothetical protein
VGGISRHPHHHASLPACEPRDRIMGALASVTHSVKCIRCIDASFFSGRLVLLLSFGMD